MAVKSKEATQTLKSILSGNFATPHQSKNIAMFHAGRSGSTVLGDLLNQNPQIFWDSEIFQPARMKPLPSFAIRSLSKNYSFLLNMRRSRTDKPIYGFETKFAHLTLLKAYIDDYVQAIEKLNFHYFIVLERKNLLRRLVSHLIGVSNKQWHVGKNKQSDKKKQIELDVHFLKNGLLYQPLIAHLEHLDYTICAAKQFLQPYNTLYLSYEDDIQNDPTVGFNKISDFIEIPRMNVTPNLRKTNPYPLSDIIINYEDVEKMLRNTRFEWMLDQ